jgi:hypothetical protein
MKRRLHEFLRSSSGRRARRQTFPRLRQGAFCWAGIEKTREPSAFPSDYPTRGCIGPGKFKAILMETVFDCMQNSRYHLSEGVPGLHTGALRQHAGIVASRTEVAVPFCMRRRMCSIRGARRELPPVRSLQKPCRFWVLGASLASAEPRSMGRIGRRAAAAATTW